MKRLALFDCDGTLVDSQANICRAMEEAFAGAKLTPPDRHSIRRIVGLSLVEAVAQLIPDAEASFHAVIAEDYKRQFTVLRSNGGLMAEPLFDGITDALDMLQDAGWILGVATGKSDRGLSMILAHHDLSHRFTTLQTADRHPSKPHPSMVEAAMEEAGASPETCVVIGDTSYDMLMATNAGAFPVGVGWGYHAPDELTAAGAAHVVEHADELAGLLEQR